jgi:hypothetical protein
MRKSDRPFGVSLLWFSRTDSTNLSRTKKEGSAMIDFDDFDWEDGVVIGSFFDYMVDQKEADEKRRKKREHDPDYDPMDDFEEDIDKDEDPAP